MAKYLVGIDVGGTFTDLVAFDREKIQSLSIKFLPHQKTRQ